MALTALIISPSITESWESKEAAGVEMEPGAGPAVWAVAAREAAAKRQQAANRGDFMGNLQLSMSSESALRVAEWGRSGVVVSHLFRKSSAAKRKGWGRLSWVDLA
jgi:hypothetical protein